MRLLPAVVTAAAVAVAAGCGSGPAVNAGPFGGSSSYGGGGACAPVTGSGSIAAGEQFGNARNQVAVIKSVTLWENDGLQLVSAWVLPILRGSDPLGARTYPPVSIAAWARRVPAAGARIAPSHGQQQLYNLVVQLRPVHHSGTARAVSVSYESGGTVYVMRQDFAWTITRGHCS